MSARPNTARDITGLLGHDDAIDTGFFFFSVMKSALFNYLARNMVLKGTAFKPICLDKYYLITCFYFLLELSKRKDSKLFRCKTHSDTRVGGKLLNGHGG